MERIIKTVYNTFYQQTTEVSYKEQVIVTGATIIFILGIIIPFSTVLLSYFNA